MTRARRRVLMVHWDGAGNLPPQRALARELVRRGHEVHVLSHDSVRDRVVADGAAFHRLATATQTSAAQQHRAGEEPAWLLANVIASRAFAADFVATATPLRPDVVLVDAMLLAVLDAATARGHRVAAMCHSVFARRLQDRFDVAWQALTGMPHARFADFLAGLPLSLVFSYEALADRPLPPRVVHVGPIREAVPADPRWRRHPHRPFVLVSFSTGFQDQLPVLRNVVGALSRLEVEALVTVGPSVDPGALRAPDGIAVVVTVPHDAVLPVTDLVVTHGGHGTVAAALGAGVPLLCLPGGRDQPVVAAAVERLGLGRTLAADAEPAAIAATVGAMIDDGELRARARAFGKAAARFGDLAAAGDLVEALAAVGLGSAQSPEGIGSITASPTVSGT